MKKLWAVVLAAVIIFIPCATALAREQGSHHYYIICKKAEVYKAYPIEAALEYMDQNPAGLLDLLNEELEEIGESLHLEEEGWEPFGLLIDGVTQEIVFPSMTRLNAKPDYPVFFNNSQLTVQNIAELSFVGGLYLLESSLRIPVETLPGYGTVKLAGTTLLDGSSNRGLFHFSKQGSFTLKGNARSLPLPLKDNDITSLVQTCGALVHSYELKGDVFLQRELALDGGQSLSLESGGTLGLPDAAALTLRRGALFQNKGGFHGVIHNQGRVYNAQGAVIGGSHFYNLPEGEVHNAGLMTSSRVMTQKGSVIRNLENGRLTAMPTGEGDFPGKVMVGKPAPHDGTLPPGEEAVVPPRQDPVFGNSRSDDGDDDDNSLPDSSISLALVDGETPQLDKVQIVAATKAAVEQAGPQDRQAVVRLSNPGELDVQALKFLWEEEKKFPLLLYIFSPGKDGKGIGARLAVKPSALVEPCSLLACVDNEGASKTQELFERCFTGNVRVVSLGYQGDFAKPVEVAAKLDLSCFGISELFFYAYHPPANTYREISSPQHWVDSKGFLHFYTSWGGDLVITDVQLPGYYVSE